MKTLGIVPARSGSKRLPGKNLALVGGKSLVRIAAECGLSALDHVVVSTDSEEIYLSAIGGRLMADDQRPISLRMRPQALATDEAKSMDAVRDAVGSIDVPWDIMVLLQPTSPLRSSTDVWRAVELLGMTGADAVISISAPPPTDWLYQLGHANRIRPYAHQHGVCSPNGAIYALTRKAYEAGLDWESAPIVYALQMPKWRSVDVDTAEDLAAARALADRPTEDAA